VPRFQTSPLEVEAVQLRCSYTFGKAKGCAGDWLVIHADGRQEIVGAAAFLATYVLVANGEPAAPPAMRGGAAGKPSSRRRSSPRAAGRKNGGRPSDTVPSEWAEARTRYERGDAVAAIAGQLKLSPATVYGRASKEHWKRPPGPGVKGTAAPAKPEPKGEHLRGRVRCPSCESMTEYDPCEHCGKAIKFKG